MASMPDEDAASGLLTLVGAWWQSTASVLALVDGLPEDQAERPTDLSGWNVRDVLAHLGALEHDLTGADPLLSPIEAIPPDAVEDPFRAYTERGVAARRGWPLPEVLAELREAAALRHDRLLADPPVDPDAPAPSPPGTSWGWGRLLHNRVVDMWMHEQDIRRALGRPGGWDSAGAAVCVAMARSSLPFVLGKRLRPGAGTVVRWRWHGPMAGERTVAVGEDGRARVLDEAPPAESGDHGVPPLTTLTLSTEDLLIATGGRRAPDRLDVEVSGDADLARALLAAMAITP